MLQVAMVVEVVEVVSSPAVDGSNSLSLAVAAPSSLPSDTIHTRNLRRRIAIVAYSYSEDEEERLENLGSSPSHGKCACLFSKHCPNS